MVKNSGFSLIEVIFAIVIMGIIVVSLPVMMGSNNKGVSMTIVQEAIFGASTELNQALSYRWDENSRDDVNNSNGLAYVIETGDCDKNSSSVRFRLRPGHIVQALHRRCLDSNITAPSTTFGLDAGDGGVADDIDDISLTAKPMFLNSGSKTGYKQGFRSEFKIEYVAMGGTIAVADHDAKLITITVKEKDTEVIVTKLRSYTLNIGEIDFHKRTY